MRGQNKKLFGFLILFIFFVINVSKAADPNPKEAIWSNWGGNLHNTHYQKTENTIGPENVGNLELKGTIELAPGEVNIHAFPTVMGNTVYFVSNGPFAGGSLSAYNINSRQKIWSNKIAFYSEDPTHNWSRTSPAIYRNTLVIST